MITAIFNPDTTMANAYGLWQWDYGQVLRIQGLHLPSMVEIHFSLQETGGTSASRVGVTKDGVTDVIIPDSMLENDGATKDYDMFAFVYLTDATSGQTEYKINLQVESRPKPEVFGGGENPNIFHEAVQAVQKSATNAALSEQAAKTAETNAQTAQAGAETAEGNAELAERNAKASEQAVEKAKQLVTQMGQEVLDNKNHVDQTAQAFDQTAQQAVADVNNAGQTQTERVQSAGNTAVESVKAAQTAATKAVETAKAEAVKAVQTEGTTQTGNVTAEGAKQVQAVQAAAQEIVADREQIAQNKADIADIREEMDNLSSAIINSATGESIVVGDSSSNKFRGLSIYGKSEQLQTTGAQLLNPADFQTNVDIDGCSIYSGGDGSIIVSKQNTSSSIVFELGDITDKLVDGKTYCLGSNAINGKRVITQFVIKRDTGTLYQEKMAYNNNLDKKVIARIVLTARDVINGTIYPVANEGESAKSYEPYTGGKPSPSVEYPQEIANAGDGGSIIAEIGNDGYVEKGMRFAGNKKIPLKKGSYLCLKNNNAVNAMNAYVVDDGDLISKLTNDSSDALYNYCQNELRITNQTLSGNIIKSNTRISQIWHNGLIYKIENDGLYLYYSCNSPVHDSDDCYVWFLDSIGSMERPYKLQSLTIPTPNSLPGIKVDSGGNYTDASGQQWVCDEIDLERGKYVQRIAKYSPVESTISQITDGGVTSGKTIMVRYQSKSKNKKKFRCLSNFLSKEEPQIWTIDTECYNHAIDGYVDFRINKDRLSTVDITGIKDFCRKIDAKFYYTLESPIEHDLPPEVIEAYKKLHTNYPVTTVLNDAGAGMKVEYVADTKHYIDKKFEELNAKVVNTQIALL